MESNQPSTQQSDDVGPARSCSDDNQELDSLGGEQQDFGDSEPEMINENLKQSNIVSNNCVINLNSVATQNTADPDAATKTKVR